MSEAAAQPAPATNNTSVFRVVLNDGEREINSGNITIHSNLSYNQFQRDLTEITCVPNTNVTTYLVDVDRSWSRIITGNVTFDTIVQEKECYFLVVLKSSRKSRDRQRKHGNYNDQVNKSSSNLNDFPAIGDVYGRGVRNNNVDRSLCLDCTVAHCEGIKGEFHSCVYDAVLEVFSRSRFGPIARPSVS